MRSSERRRPIGFLSPGENPEIIDRIIRWIGDRDSLCLFLLFYICLFAYHDCPLVGFTYDDVPLILDNPFIRDWHNLPVLLQGGRPVRALTLMLDYAVWGLDPVGYHLTNLFLHLVAGLLGFRLLKELFQNRWIALAASFLFIVHPVNTEAVLGITHRKEMLAMIFLLLAFFLYIRKGRSWPGYLLSLASYVLALLSKQVALALPFLLIAHELIISRSEKPLYKRLITILPFFLVPALAFLLVFPDFRLFSRFKPPDFADLRYPMILATSIECYVSYLKLSFFPFHLSVDHVVPVSDSILEPRLFLALALIIISVASGILLSRKKPVLSFGIFWFLINLLPVMNIVPSNTFLAERYLYIPCLGICLFLAGLMDEVTIYPVDLLPRRHHALAEIALASFVLFLATLSYVSYFRPTLWEELYPLSITQSSLIFLAAGLAIPFMLFLFVGLRSIEMRLSRLLYRLGILIAGLYLILVLDFLLTWILCNGFLTGQFSLLRIDVAEHFSRWYEWTREMAPPAQRELFHIVGSGTTFREAVNFSVLFMATPLAYFFFGIIIYRRYSVENVNSAICFLLIYFFLIIGSIQIVIRTRDWGSDVSLWKSTVQESPDSVVGWNNLGRAYARRSKIEEAEKAFLKAHELAPNRPDILTNLGLMMVDKKDYVSGRYYFEQAIKMSPLEVKALLGLANIHYMEGETHKAVEIYLDFLRIQPESAHAHYNLALCFERLNDPEKAAFHALQALRIDPQSVKARKLLDRLRAGAHSSRQ